MGSQPPQSTQRFASTLGARCSRQPLIGIRSQHTPPLPVSCREPPCTAQNNALNSSKQLARLSHIKNYNTNQTNTKNNTTNTTLSTKPTTTQNNTTQNNATHSKYVSLLRRLGRGTANTHIPPCFAPGAPGTMQPGMPHAFATQSQMPTHWHPNADGPDTPSPTCTRGVAVGTLPNGVTLAPTSSSCKRHAPTFDRV